MNLTMFISGQSHSHSSIIEKYSACIFYTLLNIIMPTMNIGH